MASLLPEVEKGDFLKGALEEQKIYMDMQDSLIWKMVGYK